MAFTQKERNEFLLHGLLPPRIATLKQQRERSYLAFKNKPNDLEKYIYLRDLQDSNETLYYSLICSHLDEMLPIVYTPTVGLGCQKFSHIYRRPRGIFISYPLRGQIEKILDNERFDSIEVIVVSDGERILGLGDQGAGGMGIPIGKLALYSACGGFHPRTTLPIILDVGTDNQDLIKDPLYLGWKHKRIRGKKYFQFIDSFVKAIKKRFPNILLQWEDFAGKNAAAILEKYSEKLCTFNDDIQGTAAVVAGTLLAAVKTLKMPIENHRFVIAGAGSAGCGIGHLMAQVLMQKGLSCQEAYSKFYLLDRNGLLIEGQDHLISFQTPFCQKKSLLKSWGYAQDHRVPLHEVVEHVKPTVLIGVSGKGGLFTKEIIEKMAQHCQQPIIFPLSNPTSCSEATPEDIIKWTDGKALIGTGSPFDPIMKNGKSFRVDQTNNAYIFPGLGLGIVAVKAKRVTESMFIKAAEALAKLSPALKNPQANLLPPLDMSRKIAFKIAYAVAKEAVDSKLAEPLSPKEIEKRILEKMWKPVYLPYRRVREKKVTSQSKKKNKGK